MTISSPDMKALVLCKHFVSLISSLMCCNSCDSVFVLRAAARGQKLLCSLAVRQRIRLCASSDGSRVNRLWLGGSLSSVQTSHFTGVTDALQLAPAMLRCGAFLFWAVMNHASLWCFQSLFFFFSMVAFQSYFHITLQSSITTHHLVSSQRVATRMSLCVAAGSDFYVFTFHYLLIINYCILIDPKLASHTLQLCLNVQF